MPPSSMKWFKLCCCDEKVRATSVKKWTNARMTRTEYVGNLLGLATPVAAPWCSAACLLAKA